MARAADTVERVNAAGLLLALGVVAEYGSPHGGSWLGSLRRRIASGRTAMPSGRRRTRLLAIIDASPAQQGLRMPRTDIPVAGPGELAVRRPDTVLLFVADLRVEVRDTHPEVEAEGGRWLDARGPDSGSLQQGA